MDNNPKVSIIIPHYNNYDIIKDCLESIKNLTFENLFNCSLLFDLEH